MTKTLLGDFRGIKLKFKESYNCKSLPPIWDGKASSLYQLDRWQPYGTKDKYNSNELFEKHLEWVPTYNDDVIFGLERWGALIPNQYTEWFSIITIHHLLISSSQALSYAALAQPLGLPKE